MSVPPPETYDTPTHRATISQLTVDELDAWLDAIRSRRLVVVQRLEAAAKVRADSVRLSSFLKLETSISASKRALVRLDAQIERVEKMVHKCRILALDAMLEVEAPDAAAD